MDREIINLIQDKPTITHTEISTKVDRSQPTVGLRIKKLEEMGILQFQAGVNIKVADLVFARVEIQTNKPEKIISIVKKCPFMLNAFRVSGNSNLSVLIANSRLDHLDKIINRHFRNNQNVISVHMDIITEVVKDFVLPFDMSCKDCNCGLDLDCKI
ncbi:MAG: Lrp/AsnC family transcriptional regulator [Candidatus Lokiarchaeota archaeon]